MNLQSLRVRHYKSIEDSGWVDIDDLTCLIGRNESGKTGFMEAVEKLNPAYRSGEYHPYEEYPRQDWPEFDEEDPAVVVSARLDLDEEEIEAVEATFVEGLLSDSTVTVHRDYGNEFDWTLPFDDRAALEGLGVAFDLPDGIASDLEELRSISALAPDGDASELRADLTDHLGDDPRSALADAVGHEVLEAELPEFRYVGESSIMNGEIDVEQLLERRENEALTHGDRVFLALLSIAGIDLEEFRDVDDWRPKTAELEAAAADVNDEVARYWSQSGDIQIRIGTRRTEADDRLLEVRVENNEHNVSVEFEGRSLGFRQFFSTFCELSELRSRDSEVVLLLDEPGLNLHARAKQEFLAFLKTELAPHHPIVYTTHSPFMIDPDAVHRVKMVEDEPVGDENVFDDVSLADEYTSFPLRNVFEVDLMETMLVRPHTLLVERKADHAFLYVAARLLEEVGETGLDARWTVVPIKHEQNIGTFVSLFGEDSLDVAALLNEDPTEGSRSDAHEAVGEMPVKLLPEYSSVDAGTVEDVFSEPFYLELLNRTYASAIEQTDGVPDRITAEELSSVAGSGPIVDRVRTYFEDHGIGGGEFDRNRPARYLQRNRNELAAELDGETIRNFDRLFTDLNNTLESFDGVESRSGSFFGGLFG